jgi:hypothetical protein
MAGSATLTADPIKGIKKAASVAAHKSRIR